MLALEIEPGTSGSVVRNSDHYTTEEFDDSVASNKQLEELLTVKFSAGLDALLPLPLAP
jgi:hypothetical protein